MLTLYSHSTSWRRRNEEGIPKRNDREPHRRDGRDSDQRRHRRRHRRILRLGAFFGVTKASAAQLKRWPRRGLEVCSDAEEASEENDEEDDVVATSIGQLKAVMWFLYSVRVSEPIRASTPDMIYPQGKPIVAHHQPLFRPFADAYVKQHSILELL
jgi:hypothetical protein